MTCCSEISLPTNVTGFGAWRLIKGVYYGPLIMEEKVQPSHQQGRGSQLRKSVFFIYFLRAVFDSA